MYNVKRIDDGEETDFVMTVCGQRVVIEIGFYCMFSTIDITITKEGRDEYDNLTNWFYAEETIWGIVSIAAPFGYKRLSEHIIREMKSANIMSDVTTVIGDTITDYFKGGDE